MAGAGTTTNYIYDYKNQLVIVTEGSIKPLSVMTLSAGDFSRNNSTVQRLNASTIFMPATR
jgi:hypothetical protein